MSGFDEKTTQQLKYYVYLLVDPRDKKPFYVGKGTGNRVFAHLEGALKEEDVESLKYELIRNIKKENMTPDHFIVRHGLDNDTAFEVEAALIDVLQLMQYKKTNIASGHKSDEHGLMTTDEVIRLTHAKQLDSLPVDVVAISIRKKYKRGFLKNDIYEAIKEAWVIAAWRRERIKYVLAEYRGLIVEVFEIDKWYEVDKKYGFTVKEGTPDIREYFINKSVARLKNGQQWSLLYSKDLHRPGKM